MSDGNSKAYLYISGIIFAIVAIIHLIRVVNGWDFVLGPWSLPMFFSILGTIGPGLLSAWAFTIASSSTADSDKNELIDRH
jgi:hypothetical protein